MNTHTHTHKGKKTLEKGGGAATFLTSSHSLFNSIITKNPYFIYCLFWPVTFSCILRTEKMRKTKVTTESLICWTKVYEMQKDKLIKLICQYFTKKQWRYFLLSPIHVPHPSILCFDKLETWWFHHLMEIEGYIVTADNSVFIFYFSSVG